MKQSLNNKDIIIISAINFSEGGPLSILKDCLEYLSKHLAKEYQIIALVHSKKLCYYSNIKYYEFPLSKKSWFIRLYYEYFYFKKLSRKLKPFLWLSLHDITPNVESKIKAVYCHNPSPFYKISFNEIRLDFKFFLFNIFYKFLYKINISKNTYIIVQQQWLRDEFYKLYNHKNIIVAHPRVEIPELSVISETILDKNFFSFIYPAFPRVFKNFEVICEAIKILNNNGIDNFEVLVTLSGKENLYAKKIFKKYKSIKSIKFIGLKSRKEIFDLYSSSDCLIFPSKLETWGLPLSEFKVTNKPIIVANKLYAKETIGEYDKVVFFNNSAEELADIIKRFLGNELLYERTQPYVVASPCSNNWSELFDLLLAKKQ